MYTEIRIIRNQPVANRAENIIMLELDPDTHTARYYEGQMAGSIFHIYSNGEDILQALNVYGNPYHT